jgi:hypothetical protein
MLVGGIVEAFLGVAAEGRSLEDLALPISAVGRDRTSLGGDRTGVGVS